MAEAKTRAFYVTACRRVQNKTIAVLQDSGSRYNGAALMPQNGGLACGCPTYALLAGPAALALNRTAGTQVTIPCLFGADAQEKLACLTSFDCIAS
jgi:hypothetical protein